MKSIKNIKSVGGVLGYTIALFALMLSAVASADSKAGAGKDNVNDLMTNERLGQLIERFDKEVAGEPGFWQIAYENMELFVITDEKSNRMRIITKVTDAKLLEKEHLYRLMQANFDSALDARYAIAKEGVWSTYLHPLGSLTEKDFYSGLAQVITLAVTFGSSFSSGALQFNGGDSKEQQRQLYESILKKGLQI